MDEPEWQLPAPQRPPPSASGTDAGQEGEAFWKPGAAFPPSPPVPGRRRVAVRQAPRGLDINPGRILLRFFGYGIAFLIFLWVLAFVLAIFGVRFWLGIGSVPSSICP